MLCVTGEEFVVLDKQHTCMHCIHSRTLQRREQRRGITCCQRGREGERERGREGERGRGREGGREGEREGEGEGEGGREREREGEGGREREREGDGPAGAGVHGEVLHCDKWRLQGLGGCGPRIRVKGQHCRQQGHKLQAVQLIGQGAILVAMATDSCEI